MTGELCSQPPLGVADTRLPCRSATSRWQVSPLTPCARRRRVRSARPRRRPTGAPARAAVAASTGPRPPGLPGRSSQARLGADERAPRGVVVRAEQRLHRHVGGVRVAVPGLAVGEGELGDLGDGVDVVGRQVPGGVQVEAGQQRELLQEDRALAPRAGLEHAVAAVVDGRAGSSAVAVQPARSSPVSRPPWARPEVSRHAVSAQNLAIASATKPRYQASRPAAIRRLAAAGGRTRLLERCGGTSRPAPGCAAATRRRAPRRPRSQTAADVGQSSVKVPLDRGDRGGDPLDGGEPALGVGDGRREDVLQPPGAPAFEHEQPGAERAGHGRGQQAGAGHEVQP